MKNRWKISSFKEINEKVSNNDIKKIEVMMIESERDSKYSSIFMIKIPKKELNLNNNFDENERINKKVETIMKKIEVLHKSITDEISMTINKMNDRINKFQNHNLVPNFEGINSQIEKIKNDYDKKISEINKSLEMINLEKQGIKRTTSKHFDEIIKKINTFNQKAIGYENDVYRLKNLPTIKKEIKEVRKVMSNAKIKEKIDKRNLN